MLKVAGELKLTFTITPPWRSALAKLVIQLRWAFQKLELGFKRRLDVLKNAIMGVLGEGRRRFS
jgi:hypothetical protein